MDFNSDFFDRIFNSDFSLLCSAKKKSSFFESTLPHEMDHALRLIDRSPSPQPKRRAFVGKLVIHSLSPSPCKKWANAETRVSDTGHLFYYADIPQTVISISPAPSSRDSSPSYNPTNPDYRIRPAASSTPPASPVYNPASPDYGPFLEDFLTTPEEPASFSCQKEVVVGSPSRACSWCLNVECTCTL